MSVKVIVDGIAWDIESWTFPGGERNVRLPEIEAHYTLGIRCVYKGSDDLVDLILVTNAIRHTFPGFGIDLDIPYFPFARQDRVMTPGEANALQAIAQVINMLDFSKVFCTDGLRKHAVARLVAVSLQCRAETRKSPRFLRT